MAFIADRQGRAWAQIWVTQQIKGERGSSPGKDLIPRTAEMQYGGVWAEVSTCFLNLY